MADDTLNPVVVLRTGQVWQMDMAIDALKRAHVPHFCQQETAAGLRLAVPAAPAAGPGTWYAVLVPEARAEAARGVLATLPFEVKTDPGVWDFGPTPRAKRLYRRLGIVAVALLALALLLRLAFMFR
jgi:hypothetical protein